ncbi:MAG: phosphodiester glycosidase family protein [Planctomycetia bacterium]|nr:phosphodiester glycosidase family protein [Planctomycetia bacterium]
MITKQAKAGWIGLLGLTLFTLACSAFGQTETYDWTLATSLYPGVKYAHYNATVPNGDPRTNQINCVQIDTTTPNLRFYAAPRYSLYVENLQETPRQTTRNFITTSQTTNQKVVAAINGNGYTVEGAAGSADLTGFAVSEGVLVSPGGVSSENPITRSSFIVNKQGNVSIVPAVPYGYSISNVQTAVSGFITDGICLSNGTPIGAAGSPEWHDTLNPRTGIGISQDSRYVYFMTIDGRQSGVSEGAYVLEVGSCLKYFGSYNGLNMDGGGSSTMAWWNPGNSSSELLNVPVGLGDVPGTERSVGINIGVYYVPEPPGADVIYHDSFARGGEATPLLLDNSEPEVRSGTLGGSATARWKARTAEPQPWSTRGERAELAWDTPMATQASAWLPFTPQEGYVYTYSLDVNCSGNTSGNPQDWFAFGFLSYPGDPGIAWFSPDGANAHGPGFLVRSAGYPHNQGDSYTDADCANLEHFSPGTAGGEHAYKIVLDTTGAAWKASFDVDDGAYTRSYTYATNPTITHLGFGNGGGKGWVDSFTLTVVPGSEPRPIPGDANRDGVVDDKDASVLGVNWQLPSGANWSMGDFNGDKKVDDADAAILAAHWGQRAAGGPSVPEPSTVALLLGALASLFVWRRCGSSRAGVSWNTLERSVSGTV